MGKISRRVSIDDVIHDLLGRPRRPSASEKLVQLVLTRFGERVIDLFLEGVQNYLKQVATAKWNDFIKNREALDRATVMNMDRINQGIELALADPDGPASFLPTALHDELRKQLQFWIRRQAWTKRGHTVRGRFVRNGPGRPKKGTSAGLRIYRRPR